MSLTERLRSIVRCSPDPAPVRGPGSTNGRIPTFVDPAWADMVADMLDGEWRESSGQRYLVIERAYPPGHRHGHTALADGVPEHDGCWPALAVLEPAITRTRVLFIDLETTGLAGGAGTYAFLVGCAWFDGATFRVRQVPAGPLRGRARAARRRG